MIFAELPPVVYIHALLFECFFLIPYASALAAEPSHLTKINKNNVVLHITPMICSPTQAFLSLLRKWFSLSAVRFVYSLQYSFPEGCGGAWRKGLATPGTARKQM